MMYNFCDERNVPYEKKGKLIVATNEAQLQTDIPRILGHAKKNGVDDLKLLSGEDVSFNFEPSVTCQGAIFSPSTGVVDSHNFMVALLADAEEHGATLALNSSVTGASNSNGAITIEAEGMQLECDSVVNCAGLHADRINTIILDSMKNSSNETTRRNDGDEGSSRMRQYFAKGNYYRLEGQKAPFQHLVYPVPEKGGLGVHATIDLGGNTRFGPDVEWMDMSIRDPDDIDLTVDPNRADLFYDEVRKYWPSLMDGALAPDYAGIRPKVDHPDLTDGRSMNVDFVIQGKMQHGIKGFVNMLGIESPGLTASMAIGDHVLNLLVEDGTI
eukprot:scaffold169390_cov44-Attheya_sp.AAC.2